MRRHRLDLLSLVSGLLLLACVGLWAAWERGVVSAGELVLVLPGALVVLGGAGVAASLLAPHRDPHARADNDTDANSTERIPS